MPGNNNELRGNKGEWSEVYALFKLLGDGRLYSADENLNRLKDQFYDIQAVYRYENSKNVRFEIPEHVGNHVHTIKLYVDDQEVNTLSKTEFSDQAQWLLRAIKESRERTFTVKKSVDFLSSLYCYTLKARSDSKSDILMKIYDINTGYTQKVGFSIKSELGSAPSLVNASQATNFLYEVVSDEFRVSESIKIESVNVDFDKVKERVAAIFDRKKHLEFSRVDNRAFSANLRKLDGDLPHILAYALIYYYRDGLTDCKSIVERLEKENPLGFDFEDGYRIKFKRFLEAVALGMVPTTPWTGEDEATGGYIVVTKSGDVLAYHLYRREYFKEYLLNHTKLDTGSTSRNKFGEVYYDNYMPYIKLNLLVRFK